jgi:hypothetical protein
MKRSSDDELNESFEKLNHSIRLKPEFHEHLRNRILLESKTTVKKTSTKKIWISVATAILLLVGSSPFYSPTMASLAAKILPLEIPVKESPSDSLHAKIIQFVEQAGYELSSVGTKPNPYTIEIVLMKGEDSLSSMKKVLEPDIEQFLHEQGIDQYKLNISQFEGSVELPEKYRKSSALMESVGPIISDAFLTYGYSDLAQHATFGISEKFLSNILEIDMPDHVKEAKEILNMVIESIAKDDLDIKDVQLRYYNAEHRSQDNRWGYIATNIYKALAGKSIYNATGISYKVKDGLSQVWIKTAFSERPDEQIISEIETALRTYLTSKEMQETIQSDRYTIQLLAKDKTVLLEVSTIAGE